MELHPLAGKSAPESALVNVARLVTAYYALRPDATARTERVAFGTSGHRGSAFASAFNEAHILAITQAVCDYRRGQGIDGPLYLGRATHALSEPAFASGPEGLAAPAGIWFVTTARPSSEARSRAWAGPERTACVKQA